MIKVFFNQTKPLYFNKLPAPYARKEQDRITDTARGELSINTRKRENCNSISMYENIFRNM